MEASGLWIQRIAVVGVIIAMTVIGLIQAKKKIKGSSIEVEDFWVAGRNLSPWILGLTLSATWADSGMFVGTASSGYANGLVWFIPFWLAYAFTPWVLHFTGIAKMAREAGFVTTLDVFRLRYGRTGAIVGVFFSAAAEILWASSGFLALALSLSVLLGVPLILSIISIAVIILVITLAGGMWAVAYTDALQFFLLFIGQVALLLMSIYIAGGFGALAPLAERTGLDGYPMLSLIPNDFPGVVTSINYLIFISVGGMLYNSIFTRFCSARDAKATTIGNIFFGSFYIVWEVILILIGLFAAVILGPLDNPDTAISQLVINGNSYGYIGLLVGILVALGVAGAAISTNTSNLLACSTMFTRNFVDELWPNLEGKRMLLIIRLTTLVVAVLMVLIAILVPNVVFLVLFCTELLFATLAAPFIFGFFWKEANGHGAIASMIVGSIVWITTRIFLESTGIFPAAATLGLIGGSIAMVIVSKITNNTCPPVPLLKNNQLPM